MAKKINLTTVPPDKQIQLTVGGLFYQRLNKLLIEYSNSLGKENVLLALSKIERGLTANDDAAFNLETLMILIRDIEKEFSKEGFMVTTEIDLDEIQATSKEKG